MNASASKAAAQGLSFYKKIYIPTQTLSFSRERGCTSTAHSKVYLTAKNQEKVTRPAIEQ